MQRAEMLRRLQKEQEWDIVIIGGGATGLGTLVDASSRGYKTLLLERFDFAKGTSSRATKLVHGGVRYLAQGNIKLVMEALRERGLLLKNAPHITRIQPFVLPVYGWWQKWFYAIGLRIYDWLSGKLSIGKTKLLSKKQTKEYLPALNDKGLSGGILYYDGQFDDARLALNLAQTGAEQKGCVINYMDVKDLVKTDGLVKGVVVEDTINNKEYSINAKVVVNATGVFVDDILQLDDEDQHELVAPSQGIHLVTSARFFPGKNALMIPKTDDGRVLFAVPWHNEVIIGTTDTAVEEARFEPRALEQEVDFIFRNLNSYLSSGISKNDIKAVFAGLRPLVKAAGQKNTAMISRDHTIVVSKSKLITITGGKWTTYRKMGQDAVDNAVFTAKITRYKPVTEQLHIHGWVQQKDEAHPLHYYGADLPLLLELVKEAPTLGEKIHPAYPYIKAQVVWAVRHEMAMKVEDVLARRIRLLFLDAKAAMESAPVVATLMAKEIGQDENWITDQVNTFAQLAKGYLLS